MASPAIVGTPVESNTTTDGTAHVVNRDAGVSGQLSILLFAYDGGSAVNVTAFSEESYTEFGRQDDGTGYGILAYYRWEDATEDTSFSITTDDLEKTAHIAFTISGAANPATQPPEFTSATAASSNAKQPPAISPTGGSKDYLFIVGFVDDGEEIDDDTWGNGVWTNYSPATMLQKTTAAGGTPSTNVSLAAAYRQATTATETPADLASATDVAHTSVLFTIAVHPGGAATLERAASLDAVADVASVPQRDLLRSVSIDPTATVASASQRDVLRQVSLDAIAEIVSAGQKVTPAVERAASLDAVADVVSVSQRDVLRQASLDVLADIVSAGQRDLLRLASLDGIADVIAAGGVLGGPIERAASLDAVADITSAIQRDVFRQATLDAVAVITAAGTIPSAFEVFITEGDANALTGLEGDSGLVSSIEGG